jgi:hypothetical protein
MVHLTQTVHLSCTETDTISKRIKMRFYMTHIIYEFHRVCPNWFLRLRYVWHQLWIYLAPILSLSPNGPKRDSTWPTSPRNSIRCVQNDFWASVRSAQTVHLSWIKVSIVSKRTKTSFHLSLVTYEYHLMRPKWFLRLWYIWRKPCTYRAPKLTLSPKGSKRDSTWPTSPRSSIGHGWAGGDAVASTRELIRALGNNGGLVFLPPVCAQGRRGGRK